MAKTSIQKTSKKGKKVTASRKLIKQTVKQPVKQPVKQTIEKPTIETIEKPQIKSNLDKSQTRKAIHALLVHHKKSAADPKKLLNTEKHLWLIIATKKISEKLNLKPIRLPLVHSIYPADTTEVCLITKDPQRTYKDLVEEHKISFVKKVIGVSKLKTKFKPYEAKRQLSSSYDLFLSDDRVLPILPPLLGKAFFDKKKQPIPVNLSKPFKKEMEAALSSTYLHLNRGACTAVKVGLSSMSVDECLDNVLTGAEAAVAKLGGWSNIQSVMLKFPESLSLPVWNCGADGLMNDEEEVEQVKGN